jgi:phosphatidylserine/phosphatidylglycerophosphate/cardiolipin synthase-like enzyme
MFLVDRRIAVIGSFHLSPPSLDWRREVALLTDDPPILAELYEFFESLARKE